MTYKIMRKALAIYLMLVVIVLSGCEVKDNQIILNNVIEKLTVNAEVYEDFQLSRYEEGVKIDWTVESSDYPVKLINLSKSDDDYQYFSVVRLNSDHTYKLKATFQLDNDEMIKSFQITVKGLKI